MDKLNLIKLFVSVVEHGSFTAVANQSGQSPSTISKAITRLEQNLGVRLVHRTTRQFQLTEAGLKYLDTAREVIALLKSTEEQLSLSTLSPTGTLKVSLPLSFGQYYIAPLIPEFCQKYPEVKLDLSFSDEYTDIVDSGMDIAIRSGKLNDSNLIARRLCPIDMGMFASPQYLREFGWPDSPDSLSQHRWILYRFRQSGRLLNLVMTLNGEVQRIEPYHQVTVDNGYVMATLASLGTGIAYMPHYLARNLVREGKLILVSKPQRTEDQAVYIYYPSRDFVPAKVKVFIEFIAHKLEEQGETVNSSWMHKGLES
ncbi:LysR family transcriptional regulator [Vibrio parahaemolyticus]|uniref:LysR family transcriptional regulator n=1 Tax=Vibrio alginolyticus TaxID=663 RepID=UPI00215C7F4B|nr:LysR family transcriptional regulator [Vibrio alginolyticus]EGR2744558.1 LysR family transcriptional regulator [Vibrio parahaemolyticus]EGR2875423.1 LysR family transcriptional regulator [Vibrio parahaemolyticus]EJC7067022.1 LysR family transcriptional regulator [Vibrio parahaemolyticus]EJF9997208.1 LysR family transcriptional regulator [Vibrio parahaemolyticus]EJG0200874.1 LysR family transcriptional regulator [Vibrio parahaemolyticus]